MKHKTDNDNELIFGIDDQEIIQLAYEDMCYRQGLPSNQYKHRSMSDRLWNERENEEWEDN